MVAPLFSLKTHVHSITFSAHRHDAVTTGTGSTGSATSTETGSVSADVR
jgi:hypothetical protein